MDTQSSSRRALKPAQEQEVAEDWRRPRTRQSSTCCRDFGTKQRESEGREVVLGTLFKLLVKDKLLDNGKVPVNAELRPLRRERRRTEVQRYGTLNEAMMSRTILHRTATQILLPPHTGYYSITLFNTYDPVKLQHRNKPLLNCITKPGKLNTACAQMPYHQNSYPISRCMHVGTAYQLVSSPGVGLLSMH